MVVVGLRNVCFIPVVAENLTWIKTRKRVVLSKLRLNEFDGFVEPLAKTVSNLNSIVYTV